MIRELLLRDLSLWGCLWQSTAFLVLGIVAGRLRRRRPARAYQAILCAMMAAALVPFLTAVVKHYDLGAFTGGPDASVYPIGAPAPIASEAADPPSIMDVPTPLAGLASGQSPSAMTGISWRAILLSAWLVATLILLARLVATFLYGACSVRHAQSLGCEEIQQTVERTASRLRVADGLQVRASERIRSPVVWCWTRPSILLVPRVLGHRDIDWTGVVAHELAHCRRWDHLTGLIAELMASLLPWNPLMWLSKRFLIRLGEQACDDWVVATGQSSEDYAESLLHFRPQRQMAFVPAVVQSKRGLATRVRRILNDGCGNPRVGIRWAMVLTIIAVCIGVSAAFAQTRPTPSKTPAKQEEKPAKSLHQAAKDGDLEQVKKLIAQGADVNTSDGESVWTPLLAAASEGRAQVVKALLEAGAKVDAGDSYGYTPLFYAIWSDDEATVKTLVSGGANVNKVSANRKDYPPLIYAIWEGHKANVKILLDAGADVDTKDENGYTSLYWAAFFSKKDVFDLILARKDWPATVHLAACKGDLGRVTTLVEGGTDANAKDEFGCTPLHWAALADSPAVADFLLAKGAEIDAKHHRWGLTPLMNAHALPVVELLVSKGADIHAKHVGGRTQLHIACSAGDKDVAEFLIRKGADVNAKDGNGATPVSLAAQGGHTDVIELLIDKGADVNVSDARGRTPLAMARQGRHTEAVDLLRQRGAKDSLHDVTIAGDIEQLKRLLSEGAKIDATDGKGQTPLHVAVLAGRKDIVELLIAKGANIDAKSNTWETTPLVAAVRAGHEEIAKLLAAKGADVNARARGDYTALHWTANNRARMTGATDIMQLLLAKGADIEARQEHGATPLACATYDGNAESTKFLLERGANIEAKLNDGETTPLLRAVSEEHVETTSLDFHGTGNR